MHFHVERIELFHEVLAFGLDYCPDETHTGHIAADGNFSSILGFHQFGKILRHFGGANQITVVAKADDGFSIGGPEHPPFIRFFLRVFGELGQMGRIVRHEELALAHDHQRGWRGLDQVGNGALGLSFTQQPAGQIG